MIETRHIPDTFEDELKECRSKRCPRHGVLVWRPPGRKHAYCSSCGSKLKRHHWSSMDDDNPPLIDIGEGEIMSIGDYNGNGNETGGGQMALVPDNKNDNRRDMAKYIPWIHFKGEYKEYQNYLAAWEKGEDMAKWEDHRILQARADEKEIFIPWNDFRGSKKEWEVYVDAWNGNRDVSIWEKCRIERSYYRGGHGGSYQTQSTPPAASDTFTCSTSPYVMGCPIFKEKNKYGVRVPYAMWQTWIWLCLKFSTEWIAYLKGEKNEEGQWVITSMYFPKQKANGAHVDAEDNEITEGTIGTVHSHVSMSAFFSEEDKKHFNHPVEMIVNRKGEMAISMAVELECGRLSRVETGILFDGNDVTHAAEEDLQSKLTDDKVITHEYTH